LVCRQKVGTAPSMQTVKYEMNLMCSFSSKVISEYDRKCPTRRFFHFLQHYQLHAQIMMARLHYKNFKQNYICPEIFFFV